MKKIMEWDFSAYGSAGNGLRVYSAELPKRLAGSVDAYTVQFVKDGVAYECDCDSAAFVIRHSVELFATHCPEADDYDVALFAGVLSDKLRLHNEREHDKQYSNLD